MTCSSSDGSSNDDDDGVDSPFVFVLALALACDCEETDVEGVEEEGGRGPKRRLMRRCIEVWKLISGRRMSTGHWLRARW